MGCTGSMAAVHPVPHEEMTRQPDGCAKDAEIASLMAENTSLKQLLAHGAGGETAEEAEIASLQEQLAHTVASLRAQIATLQDQLAYAKNALLLDGKSPPAQINRKGEGDDRSREDGDEKSARTDALELSEFARGLQQSLCAAVVEGLVLGLGLASPDDPSDVAATLCALNDNGNELIRQHCVPLLIQTMTDNIASLKVDHVESVFAANSRYADDPSTFKASVGDLGHFEMGLDRFNGRPDGDDVLSQMRLEFQRSTAEFKTRNYGGISTSLAEEWAFVENPDPAKTYPGEVGLPRGDGMFHPGRNRKLLDDLMKLATSINAKLEQEEVIAVRLYTGPAYMFLNTGLREGGRAARLKGTPNFPATCAAFNSAIKKLRLVTHLPLNRKLYRGLCGMSLPEVNSSCRPLLVAGLLTVCRASCAPPKYAEFEGLESKHARASEQASECERE